MVSIFHFVPNSEALGAHSLASKLTIGRDSQSLEVVEELQPQSVHRRPVAATAASTNTGSRGGFFLLHMHKNYVIQKFRPKILFQRNQPIIPKEIPE